MTFPTPRYVLLYTITRIAHQLFRPAGRLRSDYLAFGGNNDVQDAGIWTDLSIGPQPTTAISDLAGMYIAHE